MINDILPTLEGGAWPIYYD